MLAEDTTTTVCLLAASVYLLKIVGKDEQRVAAAASAILSSALSLEMKECRKRRWWILSNKVTKNTKEKNLTLSSADIANLLDDATDWIFT